MSPEYRLYVPILFILIDKIKDMIKGDMMNILIITLNTHGGMTHYVSQLANALSKREQVTVIAPIGLDRKNFSSEVKIIEMHLGTIGSKLFLNTFLFWRPLKLLKTIYNEKPDIIHFNENHLWLGLFLPFLTKFSIVTTIHDTKPHQGNGIIRRFEHDAGKKIFIKFSDCIIVHGETAKSQLQIKKKCYVVPHGDYSFFLKFKKSYIYPVENILLFFGRIEEYKGLDWLILSMDYIINEMPDVKLIIAGQGDLSKYGETICDTRHYEIHNQYIPDEEVPYFFERARIVVLPYIEGTQTGVIPIASAFKKPVVATDVGSIPEALEEGFTGYIVPPKDEKAFAEAVLKLLKNDELARQMGENAYIKMRNELSWDTIVDNMINIYKSTI